MVAPIYECRNDNFLITTDPATFDLDTVHAYLTRSYWKRGVPKEYVVQSVKNSFCFGLFDNSEQIGFARVITDYTDFAYLSDIFVLEAYQGHRLGSWLLESIISCPRLQGVRNFILATRDAHPFYRQFGFQELDQPERWMIKCYEKPWFIPE